MTAEAYLELDGAAAFRSEYLNGEMFAKPGGSVTHSQLIVGVGGALEDALEDGPCVVTLVDMRLEVMANRVYVYPDVMVFCDPPIFAAGRNDVITNPSVVVEVLTESTEAWDRGGKFALYRGVASLREYLLVSTDAARVEWFTREGEGCWSFREAVGLERVVRLERLGVDLGLGRIYRKVELLG